MIRKSEAGQALVLGALAMVALLAVVGLAADMGVLRYDKRLQQTAADAAALAGASNLAYDAAGSPGVIGGALTASAQNGYTNTVGNGCAPPPTNLSVHAVAVTVCNPPRYGPHTGDSDYVEAYVSVGQPTFFMKILGINSETVTARAVATTRGASGPGSGCLWTLGPPTASIEGVNINGNPTLNAPTCGITDNGDFNTKGNALVVNASTFTASGTWVNHGTKPGDITCSGWSSDSPCPVYPTAAVTDPLAGLAAPTAASSGGDTISISGNGNPNCGPAADCSYDSSTDTYYINEGTYCSITINGVAQDQVVFESGLYIIDGTGSGCSTQSLNIPGNATISGTGVTFYFTNSSTLNITGTPMINLTAPSSGTYAGMLFWQDPNDTNTNGPQMGGNSGSSFNGLSYFPADQLTFFGNNTSFSVSEVICYSVLLSGNPTVNLQGSASMPAGANPIKTPVLVE